MLAIKNFGHYWSRDLIDWGERGRGNSGSIKGAMRVNADAASADFRLQIAIYCLFNHNREVVYLGQTGRGDDRLLKRLKTHARGPMRDRWTNFSWFGFLGVGDYGQLIEAQDLEQPVQGNYAGALDEMEAVLLQIIEPRLNKQGPRWGNAENRSVEYYQFSDHEPNSLESISSEIAQLRGLLDGRLT